MVTAVVVGRVISRPHPESNRPAIRMGRIIEEGGLIFLLKQVTHTATGRDCIPPYVGPELSETDYTIIGYYFPN
jgi:hypothetical protein